tara:strand:+ start:2910 stop:3449 length:540 start_codon:yes stop_codon:yes gene_type:complete
MELSNTYITEDIIDLIFNKLNHDCKISFSQINKYSYNKYKHSIKYLVYNYVNLDYLCFKKCFQKYNYSEEELIQLGNIAIKNVKTIWGSALSGYYDLRYIFELIYNGLDIKHSAIVENTNALNLKVIMEKIKQCISWNRSETINNINNEVMLYPLQYRFQPILKDIKHKNIQDNNWNYI